MLFFLSKFLPVVFSPLDLVCILIVLSMIAQIRHRSRIAMASSLTALSILLLMGTPMIEHVLLSPLETRYVPSGVLPRVDAIVVLGGVTAPAFPPQPTVHLGCGGDRLTYAAELYREHKAPVVVLSGQGMPWNKSFPPESAQMAEILKLRGVPGSAILQESLSHNTHENAAYVKKVLLAHKIGSVLLVTSASVMPRALAVFRHEGIDTIPAPTDFITAEPMGLREPISQMEVTTLRLLPDSDSLDKSSWALRQYAGLVVYRLVGWI